MGLNIIREFIRNPQIYKFLIVSTISTLVTLFFTAVLTSMLGIFYAYSVIISLEISLFLGFFIHDKWTFSNVPKSTKKIRRFLKFNVLALLGFGINEVVLIFFTTQIKTHYLVSECIAMVITFIFNFVTSKKVTWKK